MTLTDGRYFKLLEFKQVRGGISGDCKKPCWQIDLSKTMYYTLAIVDNWSIISHIAAVARLEGRGHMTLLESRRIDSKSKKGQTPDGEVGIKVRV